jgi:hypothetical protein
MKILSWVNTHRLGLTFPGVQEALLRFSVNTIVALGASDVLRHARAVTRAREILDPGFEVEYSFWPTCLGY